LPERDHAGPDIKTRGRFCPGRSVSEFIAGSAPLLGTRRGYEKFRCYELLRLAWGEDKKGGPAPTEGLSTEGKKTPRARRERGLARAKRSDFISSKKARARREKKLCFPSGHGKILLREL